MRSKQASAAFYQRATSENGAQPLVRPNRKGIEQVNSVSCTICLISSTTTHRIRKPFESYDKELLADGYPESSKHLARLLAVRNELGVRDTALIGDEKFLIHTMNCLKNLETCERERCKLYDEIQRAVRFSYRISYFF